MARDKKGGTTAAAQPGSGKRPVIPSLNVDLANKKREEDLKRYAEAAAAQQKADGKAKANGHGAAAAKKASENQPPNSPRLHYDSPSSHPATSPRDHKGGKAHGADKSHHGSKSHDGKGHSKKHESGHSRGGGKNHTDDGGSPPRQPPAEGGHAPGAHSSSKKGHGASGSASAGKGKKPAGSSSGHEAKPKKHASGHGAEKSSASHSGSTAAHKSKSKGHGDSHGDSASSHGHGHGSAHKKKTGSRSPRSSASSSSPRKPAKHRQPDKEYKDGLYDVVLWDLKFSAERAAMFKRHFNENMTVFRSMDKRIVKEAQSEGKTMYRKKNKKHGEGESGYESHSGHRAPKTFVPITSFGRALVRRRGDEDLSSITSSEQSVEETKVRTAVLRKDASANGGRAAADRGRASDRGRGSTRKIQPDHGRGASSSSHHRSRSSAHTADSHSQSAKKSPTTKKVLKQNSKSKHGFG